MHTVYLCYYNLGKESCDVISTTRCVLQKLFIMLADMLTLEGEADTNTHWHLPFSLLFFSKCNKWLLLPGKLVSCQDNIILIMIHKNNHGK